MSNDPGILVNASLGLLRRCLSLGQQASTTTKDRHTAHRGVDGIRNIMPSGAGELVWCTSDFEGRFVDRMWTELGIDGSKPNAMLHTHQKGTLVAVSGDVFHFSAGGDLESGTVRFGKVKDPGPQDMLEALKKR